MTQTGQPITGILPVDATGAPFFLQDGEFKDTLALGQIIKGRVLRHFGGDRYLVNFSGQNRVVDSAIPLTTNELVYGRVVGLDERVELRRVNGISDAVPEPDEKIDTINIDSALESDAIQQLRMELAQHQVRLSATEMQGLIQFVGKSRDPGLAILGTVVMSKLGLRPINWQLLTAVQDALGRKSGIFTQGRQAISLDYGERGGDVSRNENSTFLATFSELLFALSGSSRRLVAAQSGDTAYVAEGGKHVVNEWNSVESGQGEGDAEYSGERSQLMRDLSYAVGHLLNAQTEGAIAHRVCTIPLLVNGELVELDVALFEQQERGEEQQEKHRYRQVVLSLELSQFGLIEVSATLSGAHIRIVVMAAEQEATEALALHAGGLREELEASGWSVDELRYETKIDRGANAVPRTVVEHIIARDSLSRLV